MTSPIFANLDGLARLARERGVDVNPTLLRVMTDLYVQKAMHSADEQRQFADLAIRLIDLVDEAALASVAGKLLACPATPVAVRARLAGAGFPRVAPAVAKAPPAQAVALPVDLSFDTFVSMEPSERRRLLSALPAAPSPVASPVDAAETVRALEACALSNKPGEFTRALERALGMSQTLAQHIVNDHSGEPLLVAAKALGMARDVFQRILLFVNPAVGHSVRRVYDLSDLYGEVTIPQALHLIAVWRAPAAAAVRSPEYRPYSWDDEARRARDAATPSQSKAPKEQTATAQERLLR